jgi:hypothetical protein
MPSPSLLSLLGKVHQDEEGTVSLETILIIGAIALPILIFLYKIVWPQIQKWFWERASDVGVTPGGNGVP